MKLDFPKGDKACPLFVGRLIRNIKNGPSPAWLQQKLTAIGLRPISALVDITNYLTFDCARPLHVFDANKIKGNLWVRPAAGGETLAALNGKIYTLEKRHDRHYGDDSGLLSLGGIMGGRKHRLRCQHNRCVHRKPPISILCVPHAAPAAPCRYPAMRVTVLNAASTLKFTVPGAELATQLVLDMCGTKETIVSKLEIAGAVPKYQRKIMFDTKKVRKHVGVDVPAAEQKKILTALGFAVKASGKKWAVQPPSWRPDVEGAADLVEEIIRVKGYDTIPAISLLRPQAVPTAAIDIDDQRANAARRALAGQGLMEAVTWSFMPRAVAAHFGPVDPGLILQNPISSDLDVMRSSILGNLIMAAKRNADLGFGDGGLFEVGPVFRNATPEGEAVVATALRAGSTPRNWAEPARATDAFDAKADAIAALAAAGVPPVSSLQITTDAPEWYHPGRSGCLRLGPALLATFGEIHPALLAACDASGPMAACEIFLASVPQSRATGTAKPLLKLEPLQPVARDFAFVVGRDVTAAKLIKAVRDADKNLIRDVTVFDVYEGEHVGADKKSVALNVTLQPTEKTLTDAEIEAVASRITVTVTKATGAVLRG